MSERPIEYLIRTTLPKGRERAIMEMRFGLINGRPKSLRATGKCFGISGERVRQIEARALRVLRLQAREVSWP